MSEKRLYNYEDKEFILEPVSDSVVKVTHREQTGYFGLRGDWDPNRPYTQTLYESMVHGDNIAMPMGWESVFTYSTSDDALNALCKSMLDDQRSADARQINAEERKEAARQVMSELLEEIPEVPANETTGPGSHLQNDLEIAGLFAGRYGQDAQLLETWPLSRTTLNYMVSDSVAGIRDLPLLGRSPLLSFRRPGLIAGVKRIQDDRETPPLFYITVESSYSVREKDYHRATDNAKILRLVTGRDAYPVVSGLDLSDDLPGAVRDKLYASIDEFLEKADAASAYWHKPGQNDL